MGTPVVAADRVLVTTTQTGTGTYALGSAMTGYFAPADITPSLNGARVGYVVQDSLSAPTQVEIAEGVLSSGSPWTLSRASIIRSLSGGVVGAGAINWGAGTKYVFITYLSGRTPQLDTDGWLALPPAAVAMPLWAGSTGGTASAYTLTTANFSTTSPRTTGVTLRALLHATSAANPTLAVNGTTAGKIYRRGPAGPVQIRAGELGAGNDVEFRYDAALDGGAGGYWVTTFALTSSLVSEPVWGGNTSGSSTAYTASLSPALGPYADGQTVVVRLHTTCGANPTLSVNGGGNRKIYKSLLTYGYTQPVAGELVNGAICEFRYDSGLDGGAGGWVLMNGTGAPMPANGVGTMGEFRSFSSAVGAALTLPAGGTWAYMADNFSNANAFQGGRIAGVQPGGTTLVAAVAGVYCIGFCWRIA